MTPTKDIAIGLDVGERRIGVAVGDSVGRLAMPLATITVDGSEIGQLQQLAREHDATRIVVGLPRNGSGQETAQSQYSRAFGSRLAEVTGLPVAYQDESLTSVIAEQQLAGRKKHHTKGAIDAHAAAIMLQDYLEATYATAYTT